GRLMVFKCSGVCTSAIWIEIGMDYNWTTKKDTQLPQTSVPQNLKADEVVHKEGVEMTITTAISLDAAHDSDNIIRTQTTTMPNVDISQGMDTSGSPRSQDTMGVLNLEKEKDVQAVEILKLKKRVKRLERQRNSSTSQTRRRKYRQVESLNDDLNEEDASKQGRSVTRQSQCYAIAEMEIA
ncbi:hypothetical protein Tco_0215440, partial [Tanacetum coccineum]